MVSWGSYSDSTQSGRSIHDFTVSGASFPISLLEHPTAPNNNPARPMARYFEIVGDGNITVKDFEGNECALVGLKDGAGYHVQISHIVAATCTKVRVIW